MSITIEGHISKVFFKNYEKDVTGFKFDAVRVVGGILPPGYTTKDLSDFFYLASVDDAVAGVKVRVTGIIENHNGRDNFKTFESSEYLPTQPEYIREYIASGGIPYLQQDFGDRLLKYYDGSALQEFERNPLLVAETISSPYSISHIIGAHKAWSMSRANAMKCRIFDVLDLTTHERGVICKDLGASTVMALTNDPFLPAKYIEVNFQKVDERIADNLDSLGISEAEYRERRIEAAVFHSLNKYEDQGHTAIPVKVALLESMRLLGDLHLSSIAEDGLGRLIASGDLSTVSAHGKRCIQKPSWQAIEHEFAQKIQFLIDGKPDISSIGSRVIDVSKYGMHEAQYQAVQTCLNNQLVIITGGPGTGKTTTVESLRASLDSIYERKLGRPTNVIAIAPSALAAERLTEASGLKASTCHSALGISPGQELEHSKLRLDADLVIIDEGTMNDQKIFLAITRALRPGTRVVVLGDVDQLPSISAGRVFGDMIDSGVIPVATLTKSYRYKDNSRFFEIVNAVKNGQVIDPIPSRDDWQFIECDSSASTAQSVVNQFAELVEGGAQPDDIQIVVPIHDDYNGTINLNRMIQEYNSSLTKLPSVNVGTYKIQLGDKVMSVEKDKKNGISNGRDGICTHVSKYYLTVDYGDRKVNYYDGSFHKIVPAWAKSIHKMQGSECKYIIAPIALDNKQYYSWQLLFTGLTRMKEKCFCIGDKEVFKHALNHERGKLRFTGLVSALKENINPIPKPLRQIASHSLSPSK